MKKLILKIEAVEDRTAPIMFTERNLPGACCCTCCCCCCSSDTTVEVHNQLRELIMHDFAQTGYDIGGMNFGPYKEGGLYDFINICGYGPEDYGTYNNIWDKMYRNGLNNGR